MPQPLEAIYENGAFRMLGQSPLPLTEGARVRLTIEPVESPGASDVLDLAADVYRGLSESDINDIEAASVDVA